MTERNASLLMEARMAEFWNWLAGGGWQIAAVLFLGAILPWERGGHDA